MDLKQMVIKLAESPEELKALLEQRLAHEAGTGQDAQLSPGSKADKEGPQFTLAPHSEEEVAAASREKRSRAAKAKQDKAQAAADSVVHTLPAPTDAEVAAGSAARENRKPVPSPWDRSKLSIDIEALQKYLGANPEMALAGALPLAGAAIGGGVGPKGKRLMTAGMGLGAGALAGGAIAGVPAARETLRNGLMALKQLASRTQATA